MKSDWRDEVRKFREWAEPQVKIGEWECNYEDWYAIYDSVEEFLLTPIFQWSREESNELLYILARDWEGGIIADDLKKRPSEIALYLAEKSLDKSDWDARWRLADVLGHLPPDVRIHPLLLSFMDDEEEYVRRRALQSLLRVGAPEVEVLALREWGREDENQQWARMNALWCWQRIKSPLLESHLLEAESPSMPHLADFARRLRNGEIDLP